MGASGVSSGNLGVDERTQPKERAYEREEGTLAGKKEGSGADSLGAEERLPESSENI